VGFQLPEAPNEARRARITRWVTFSIVVLLVALLAYLAWVGYAGSGELVDPQDPSADCRTPGTAFGWNYEAINYPRASDDDLASNADPMHCTGPVTPAGTALTASDGTHLAGWYIPAARNAGAAATVVLAHGYAGNKSDMLEWAEPLHTDYNLVLFDFRNHGQSGAASTTVGVTEQRDLRAVIDWLETVKGAKRIGVLGVSMGGAAAVNEAATDDRVDALVLDSTHATLANALVARLERAGYPLAVPGAWSILFGGLLRTGLDMSAVDPVQAVERYGRGGRPVLLVAAGRDDAIGANDPQDLLAAAEEGGADAELQTCADAGHEGSVSTCPDDYRSWVVGFFDARLAPGVAR
jgi:uncharacterized protein